MSGEFKDNPPFLCMYRETTTVTKTLLVVESKTIEEKTMLRVVSCLYSWHMNFQTSNSTLLSVDEGAEGTALKYFLAEIMYQQCLHMNF